MWNPSSLQPGSNTHPGNEPKSSKDWRGQNLAFETKPSQLLTPNLDLLEPHTLSLSNSGQDLGKQTPNLNLKASPFSQSNPEP